MILYTGIALGLAIVASLFNWIPWPVTVNLIFLYIVAVVVHSVWLWVKGPSSKGCGGSGGGCCGRGR